MCISVCIVYIIQTNAQVKVTEVCKKLLQLLHVVLPLNMCTGDVKSEFSLLHFVVDLIRRVWIAFFA